MTVSADYSSGSHTRSRSREEGKGAFPRPWLQSKEERKKERLAVEVAIFVGVRPRQPLGRWSGLMGR